MKNNSEKGCKWHFAEHKGGREIGPNDSMTENFKKFPYASLVREAIQNSLDAVNDNTQPVKVEFVFKPLTCKNYPNFFQLKEHVKGCLQYYKSSNAEEKFSPMLSYIQKMQDIGSNMYYLAISDSNTSGMDYRKNDTDCPFYAFVQAAGVTSKGNNSAGGSFGFGKAAYFNVSKINTILVSTKTKEGKNFFEGISTLCTHTINGSKRVAEGYYDNQNGTPIDNIENIPARFQRKEAGTDINIMGIDVEQKENIIKEIRDAILRNFWLSIYCQKLIVNIDSKENITSENIVQLIEERFPDMTDTNNRSTYNPRPYIYAVRLANKDANCQVFKDYLQTLGEVKLYTFKDKNAKDRISYMRAPLMLVYPKKYQSNYGFYAVFVCCDPRGNEILRNIENPAHDEWQENNWQKDGKTHPKGRNAIREIDEFIRKSISSLFATKESDILKINGLEDYLYIPTALERDEENIKKDMEREEDLQEIAQAMTTSTPTEKNKTSSSPLSMGKVLINKRATATMSNQGNLYSGHSSKRSRVKGGGAGSKKPDTVNRLNEEGIAGTYAEAVPVKYRTFAQDENGEIKHYIIIHSEQDIENGKISLLIAGDQEDERINIRYANKGKAYQNILSDLHIEKGKNVIKIKLDDNMRHAIKLDVYESK